MKESISVKKAIENGKGLLMFAPIIIIATGIFISVYTHKELGFEFNFSIVIALVGFLLAWFFWSFAVTKWKIWAFENVRNVHELKRKAIQNNLIWEDGSWFEKTEIRNIEQKQKLKQLEKKFLEKDIFHDDLNVSKETLIQFSKTQTVFTLLLGFASLIYGIYSWINIPNEYYFILMIGFGIYMIFKSIQKLKNKGPQIILNSSGIKLANSDLMSWQEIKNECVLIRRRGKYVEHLLMLDYKNQHIEIGINELNTNYDKLDKLLQVYRVRYEKYNSIQ
jgi:hypothetical protein